MAEARTQASAAERAATTGSRPEGADSEVDASRKVREMFTQIAPRYDFLNHLLSLELDRLWRARTVRRLRPVFTHRETRVLDVCCGTGDLAIEINRRYRTQVIGADFSHSMLVRAWQKAARVHSPNLAQLRPIRFVEADALRVPFADGAFDLVTSAFGFRNLANYEAGLREIHRVLKPGGTIAILEFSDPPPGLLGDLYRFYCRKLLPKIGAVFSGNATAYKYLPASVSRFLRPEELSARLAHAGFAQIGFELWTLKSVALHTATKG